MLVYLYSLKWTSNTYRIASDELNIVFFFTIKKNNRNVVYDNAPLKKYEVITIIYQNCETYYTL